MKVNLTPVHVVHKCQFSHSLENCNFICNCNCVYSLLRHLGRCNWIEDKSIIFSPYNSIESADSCRLYERINWCELLLCIACVVIVVVLSSN